MSRRGSGAKRRYGWGGQNETDAAGNPRKSSATKQNGRLLSGGEKKRKIISRSRRKVRPVTHRPTFRFRTAMFLCVLLFHNLIIFLFFVYFGLACTYPFLFVLLSLLFSPTSFAPEGRCRSDAHAGPVKQQFHWFAQTAFHNGKQGAARKAY